MGQFGSFLAAFPSSLPPSSSSQGLVWPDLCAGPFPGGKFPRSQGWRRRAARGPLGKPLLLGMGMLDNLEFERGKA